MVILLTDQCAKTGLLSYNSDYLNCVNIRALYRFVILLYVVFCAFTSVTQSVQIKTNQHLSSTCWKEIEDQGDICPYFDFLTDNWNWEFLNKICCQDYMNTTLHCQNDELDNGYWNTICFSSLFDGQKS